MPIIYTIKQVEIISFMSSLNKTHTYHFKNHLPGKYGFGHSHTLLITNSWKRPQLFTSPWKESHRIFLWWWLYLAGVSSVSIIMQCFTKFCKLTSTGISFTQNDVIGHRKQDKQTFPSTTKILSKNIQYWRNRLTMVFTKFTHSEIGFTVNFQNWKTSFLLSHF